MKELKVALEAVNKSDRLLMGKKFSVSIKKDKTPVTDIDRKAERMIVSHIKKSFPDHNFEGEEFSYQKTKSKYKWIIDPIDGTKQFIRDLPFFGTSIGLEEDGKLILGIISIPKMKMLAYAVKGKGAFLNGKKSSVSHIDKIEDAYLCFGDMDKIEKLGYIKKFMNLAKKCRAHRGYGDVYGYLLVAGGFVDIFIDTGKSWDVAGAKIIIEEAGGKMTSLSGEDSIYCGNFLTTNGKLHQQALGILKK